MLKLRCISDRPSFLALESSWNPLLEKSQSDCFFLTWEWMSTWWEVYGACYTLFILVVENEELEVVGIAPLMIGKGKGVLSHFQRRLMFISQDTDVTPEYLDFIIASGREAEVLDLFVEALGRSHRQDWDSMQLQRVLDSSVNIRHFSSSLSRHGIIISSHDEIICRYALLNDSWDDYLKNKSQHFRKRWSYTHRRLTNEGELSCLFVPQDVSLEAAYDKLVQLNLERWGEKGASFRSDAYIGFHRLLCQRIEPRGWLVLVQMTQNDKTIAAKYDYLYDGKMWGNQGGWSEEFRKMNVGEVLIGKLFEWGIEKGIREYDFLGGDVGYKERWGTAHRVMSDWTAYNATCSGKAWQCAAFVKSWLIKNLPSRPLDKLRSMKRDCINHDNQ
jgi:CelD/BcsL family acetyltransferase involved in cellulose biosynthesis